MRGWRKEAKASCWVREHITLEGRGCWVLVLEAGLRGRGGEASVDGWWWWEGRRVGEGRGTEGMWDGGLTLRRSWLVELGGGGC